jgi:TPR repeat protein
MHSIQRFVASLAIAALSCSAFGAETLSQKAMFTRLSALASTGNADIQYNLGMFLNNGIGTPKDKQAAFKYFSEAAAAGHALAAYKVGCYLDGQFPGVVAVNHDEALKFKLRAAEAGYELAQLDAGRHFAKKRDMDQALIWWERASRQGDVDATAHLAYALSGDASLNKPKAYALLLVLKQALPSTPQQLTERIAKLDSQLTAGERAEADTLRAGWVTGKTPLSQQAQAGVRTVPALIASLER